MHSSTNNQPPDVMWVVYKVKCNIHIVYEHCTWWMILKDRISGGKRLSGEIDDIFYVTVQV